MNYRLKSTILLTLLAIALGGCHQPQSTTDDEPLSADRFIGVYPFARSLGLTVAETTETHAKLTNSSNTVLIFTFGDGQVYVNTQTVGKTGETQRRSDGLYVMESLHQIIRPALKAGGYTPTQPSPSKKSGCVVVDAGHGGKDPGAPSCLGYPEKSVNLQVAQKVASLLKRKGIEVVMTRSGDTFLELEERSAIANRHNADLFVSIHSDSAANNSVRGFTIYVARSASWSSQKAANAISRSMSQVAANGRGIQQADYRVLVNTSGPAVLVELGYLSNNQDASLLRNSTHQNRLANAITEGIISVL